MTFTLRFTLDLDTWIIPGQILRGKPLPGGGLLAVANQFTTLFSGSITPPPASYLPSPRASGEAQVQQIGKKGQVSILSQPFALLLAYI